MAPTNVPLAIAIYGFQIQQGGELTPRQFQPTPPGSGNNSSTNSTAGDPSSNHPGLSAVDIIPIVFLFFVVCVGMSILGCAVTTTKRQPANQPDEYVEERRKKILHQMAAPVMRKTLDYNTQMSNCVEEVCQQDPDNGEASEIQRTREQQREVYIPPEDAEERNFYDCPICLEAILPRQMVRQMPNCTHVFHQQCCEDWICKTLTIWRHLRISKSMVCPVCRANIEVRREGVVKKPDPVAVTTTRGVLPQIW